MPSLIVFTIILGIAVALMTVFLVRSYLAPKKIAAISALIKAGRTRAAIRAAKQLVSKNPHSADTHYLLGLAYLKEDKAELALTELRTVNEIGTFSETCPEREFRSLIADLYERFGLSEEALKEYLLLIKLDPSAPGHYFSAGVLFEERKQDDVAATYFRKALHLESKCTEAHYRLGVLLLRTHRPVEARVELEAVVRAEPEHYRAWLHLGLLLKDGCDYAGAVSAFGKAQRDPESKVKALIERGSCFLQMTDLDHATVELERAVRLAEGEDGRAVLFARYLLADCYEQKRDFERAVKQWEMIYAKDPGFQDVGRKLGQFQALRLDDRMKDYLTVGEDGFREICRSLVEALGMSARDVVPVQDGCQVIAVENGSKRQVVALQPKLIRFLRVTKDIPETTARRLYEDMKELNLRRSMIVTSSDFSRYAVEFAETRPIELVNREKLQSLLTKIEL